MRPEAKADKSVWRPLGWAMALAAVQAAWLQFLNFVSCAPLSLGSIYTVRAFLNILLPLGGLVRQARFWNVACLTDIKEYLDWIGRKRLPKPWQ